MPKFTFHRYTLQVDEYDIEAKTLKEAIEGLLKGESEFVCQSREYCDYVDVDDTRGTPVDELMKNPKISSMITEKELKQILRNRKKIPSVVHIEVRDE